MEALGLLDTLESIILDGFKVPFSKKIMVDEEKLLSIIDKMRLVIQGGGGLAKEAIAAKLNPESVTKGERGKGETMEEGSGQEDSKAVDILQQAYQMAKEIREGADKYADEVLANLEATSTRILRTIKAGREKLEQVTRSGGEK
jgi:hypothetical protein